MQIALLLEMASGALGERVALGPLRGGKTFTELHAAARSVCAMLAQTHGERLAYVGLNSEAFPIALFAAAMWGRPFVPLNYRLPDAGLRRLLARTAPGVAIVDDELIARVGEVEGVTCIPRSDFLAIARKPCGEAGGTEPDPEDIAVLLFTSGTTGEPKAAVLRQRHLAAYVISTVEFTGAGAEEAALISVPPYHIAAVAAALSSTYAGRRMVYLDAFAPEDWIRTAAEERITHAMVVPTMLGRILEVLEASPGSLPHLRHLSYGGGPMPAATVERALRLLPDVNFVNAYGLTETSSTIAILTPQDHRAAFASDDPKVRARLGSVGRPLESVELEIRGPDGEPVSPGETGEIFVRGEQVSGEYLGREPLRPDGWFATRDRGWLDEDGYLFLGGRLDDVIVRGGENISPGEIEDILRAHPEVDDAAVLGMPDAEWGERVVAVIVSRAEPSVEQLKQWVRERLRSTKTPESIHFRPELPYTETGKLLRRVLRAELSAPTAGKVRGGVS